MPSIIRGGAIRLRLLQHKASGTFYVMNLGSMVGFLILYSKLKVKFTLEQATKAQKRSRGMAVLFL